MVKKLICEWCKKEILNPGHPRTQKFHRICQREYNKEQTKKIYKKKSLNHCLICGREFIPIQKTCGRKKCRKKLHRLWELENIKSINERARLSHYKRICKICGKPSVGFRCISCFRKN